MITRVSLIAIIVISGWVNAIAAVPLEEGRQVKQISRIVHGKCTGVITHREGQQLRMQQFQIRQAKVAARADGRVTKREKAQIRFKQMKANRNIYRKTLN